MSESYHVPRRSRKTCHHSPAPSGIYEIRHIASGKVYIGSALCIRCRWLRHKRELNRNKHHNPKLQTAWNKYGEDAFSHRIIEECSVDMLIVREQYWLDITGCTNHSTGFNIASRAESMLGFRHSEVSKKRISQVKSDPSEATRELLRQANLGKNRPESDCIRISQNHRMNKLSLEQVREIQQRYEESGRTITQTQLAKEYGVAIRTISSIVRRTSRKYQTDVPLSGESTRKMNGVASLPPEMRKHTEEHNRKIGKGNTGKVFSEERKHNISKALSERTLSDAHIQNLRLGWEKRRARKNG